MPFPTQLPVFDIDSKHNHVQVHSNNIIELRTLPSTPDFSFTALLECMSDILDPNQKYQLMIDTTESKFGASNTRAILEKHLEGIKTQIDHLAFYTKKNFMILMAAKFLLGNNLGASRSVASTREEAFENIRLFRSDK